MTGAKIVVADPKTGKCYQISKEKNEIKHIFGKKIKDEIDGTTLGLEGYKLKLTGGTDKDGFPMKPGVHGSARKKILMSAGVGLKSKRKGLRKKKSVRGEIYSEDIVQINAKIIEYGPKSLEEIMGGGSETEAS